MATNPSLPYWDDLNRITCDNNSGAQIGGCRLVKVVAKRHQQVPTTGTPALPGGNPAIAQCVAGDRNVYGVAAYDAPDGSSVTVHRSADVIPDVIAGGAIIGGAPCKSDAQGRAITAVTGDWAIGISLDQAGAAGDHIALDRSVQYIVP